MYTYYFEKLDVWKNSREFVKVIYEMSYEFPQREMYGLTSQLRRSASSITSNISEGFSRETNKDKARFINMSYSSALETLNHIITAKDLNYLSEEHYVEARNKLEKITNQLNALHKRLKGSQSK